MKAKPLSILAAALFSASALAGGNSASQGSSAQEPQSQSREMGAPQSELVKQAQEKLSAAGHDAGPSDGVMGPKTQAALKEFQQAKGLDSSGQLDRETLAALEIGTPEGTSASTGASAPPSSESGKQQ